MQFVKNVADLSSGGLPINKRGFVPIPALQNTEIERELIDLRESGFLNCAQNVASRLNEDLVKFRKLVTIFVPELVMLAGR